MTFRAELFLWHLEDAKIDRWEDRIALSGAPVDVNVFKLIEEEVGQARSHLDVNKVVCGEICIHILNSEILVLVRPQQFARLGTFQAP
jgi:hypothetical protein